MAITNASRLADFGTGIGTAGAIIQVDNDNNRLGVGTNNPQSTLQVGIGITMDGNAGIITAIKFVGDGSGLINAGVTTDLINSTQIKNVGVVTTGTAIVGSAVTINSTGIDAVSGVVTAANFVGGGANITALSGSNIASGTVAAARVATLNQNTTGTSAGLTGTPDITVRNVTGVAATFTGVLSYEDVTNVDSVGIVTARGGLEVGAAGVGGTVSALGHVEFVGVTTIGLGLTLTDNVKAKFGNSGDLSIYHSGSASFISDTGDGGLFIQGSGGGAGITLEDPDGNDFIVCIDEGTGGTVELYKGGVKKFSTRTDGAEIHAAEGGEAILYFTADEGDEATDKYRIAAQDSGDLIIQRHSGSGYSSELRVKSAGGVQANYQGSQKLLTITEGVKVTGVTSTTSLSVGPGVLQEKLYNVASALTGTVNFDVVDNGLVQYYTTNSSGTFVVNLRGDGSTTFNSLMDIGKTTVFTLYSAQNNASYYMTDFQIDGSSITEKWNGGSAPSAGTASGTDVYTFNIMKTADATFTVFATFSNFA